MPEPLDTSLSNKDSERRREQIPQQIAMYHKYHELVREGDYYRIASYSENHLYDCWAVSAKDKSEVLVTYVQVLSTPNAHSRKLYLKGFEPQAVYVSKRQEKPLQEKFWKNTAI